jgi:3-deoxy-D-manno-octulosonate 8-phosphate phosphatase (KDO 8-P phosphatase)
VEELVARARALRFMAFDVDGVLTDGRLYLTDAGEEIKAYSTLDGQGLKMLRDAGVELALVTGRTSRTVALRAANLGITRLLQGVADKLAAYDAIRMELGLDYAACGYMGDDLPDLAVLARCGFSATVPAAPEYIRSRVRYVTRAGGGEGAVREVTDLVLRAKGLLDAAVERCAR